MGGARKVDDRRSTMGSAIQAAFFDIDGTLVSFRTHDIPASAVEALRRLYAAGVKLFIATGRGAFGIPESVQRVAQEVPFAGYLTYNGQLCYTASGEVYRDVPLDARDVRTIATMAEEGLFDVKVMLRTHDFVNRLSDRVRTANERVGLRPQVGDLASIGNEPVYQLCVYVDPGQEDVFASACPHVVHTRWSDAFCDVIPVGGGKPAGIAATLERFGIAPDACAAFGDGGNDVPMFGCVGTSVAMGNAGDDVKAAATYVAPDIDDDGLLVACEELGFFG